MQAWRNSFSSFFKIPRSYNDFLNKTLSLNFNWLTILLFTAMWSYGVINAKTIGFLGEALIFSTILIFFNFQNNKLYDDKLTFTVKDIFVFVFLLISMFLLSWQSLFSDLSGDQFAHAKASLSFTSYLAAFFSDNFTDVLKVKPYKDYLQVISFIWLIIFFLFFFLLNKIETKTKKALFFILFFCFCRSLPMLISIITDHQWPELGLLPSKSPHPPFRTFPLLLSSSLFSISSFSFRFAQFFPLVIFLWLIYKKLHLRFGFYTGILISLVIGTIPLLWHTAIIVEQSIWTSMIWGYLCIEIIDQFSNKKDFLYSRWISIIAVGTLLRQTIFVAYIPLVVMFFIEIKSNKIQFSRRKILLTWLPGLLFLPFFLKVLVHGTPATYEGNKLLILIDSIYSGVGFNGIIYHLNIFWMIIFLGTMIFYAYKEKKKAFAFVLFFICGYSLFHIIKPLLWEYPRYIAEYIVPFLISTFVYTVLKSKKYVRYILVPILIFNIFYFKRLYLINPNVNADVLSNYYTYVKSGKVKILSESIFEYGQAFSAVKDAGMEKNTYLWGITYGFMPELLSGYTLEQLNDLEQFKTSWGPTPEELNNKASIKIVLISDMDSVQSSNEFMIKLKKLGWKKWKDFINNKNKSVIYGLIRDNKTFNNDINLFDQPTYFDKKNKENILDHYILKINNYSILQCDSYIVDKVFCSSLLWEDLVNVIFTRDHLKTSEGGTFKKVEFASLGFKYKSHLRFNSNTLETSLKTAVLKKGRVHNLKDEYLAEENSLKENSFFPWRLDFLKELECEENLFKDFKLDHYLIKIESCSKESFNREEYLRFNASLINKKQKSNFVLWADKRYHLYQARLEYQGFTLTLVKEN